MTSFGTPTFQPFSNSPPLLPQSSLPSNPSTATTTTANNPNNPSNTTATASADDCHRMLTESFLKLLNIILSQRLSITSLYAAQCESIRTLSNPHHLNKWFNLQYIDYSFIREHLKKLTGGNVNIPLQVDLVLLSHSLSDGKELRRILLERWSIHNEQLNDTDNHSRTTAPTQTTTTATSSGSRSSLGSSSSARTPFQLDPAQLYKKLTILVKALFVLIRLMPSQQLANHLAAVEQAAVVLPVQHTIVYALHSASDLHLHNSLFDSTPSSFSFTSIRSGQQSRLCVSVHYRSSVRELVDWNVLSSVNVDVGSVETIEGRALSDGRPIQLNEAYLDEQRRDRNNRQHSMTAMTNATLNNRTSIRSSPRNHSPRFQTANFNSTTDQFSQRCSLTQAPIGLFSASRRESLCSDSPESTERRNSVSDYRTASPTASMQIGSASSKPIPINLPSTGFQATSTTTPRLHRLTYSNSHTPQSVTGLYSSSKESTQDYSPHIHTPPTFIQQQQQPQQQPFNVETPTRELQQQRSSQTWPHSLPLHPSNSAPFNLYDDGRSMQQHSLHTHSHMLHQSASQPEQLSSFALQNTRIRQSSLPLQAQHNNNADSRERTAPTTLSSRAYSSYSPVQQHGGVRITEEVSQHFSRLQMETLNSETEQIQLMSLHNSSPHLHRVLSATHSPALHPASQLLPFKHSVTVDSFQTLPFAPLNNSTTHSTTHCHFSQTESSQKHSQLQIENRMMTHSNESTMNQQAVFTNRGSHSPSVVASLSKLPPPNLNSFSFKPIVTSPHLNTSTSRGSSPSMTFTHSPPSPLALLPHNNQAGTPVRSYSPLLQNSPLNSLNETQQLQLTGVDSPQHHVKSHFDLSSPFAPLSSLSTVAAESEVGLILEFLSNAEPLQHTLNTAGQVKQTNFQQLNHLIEQLFNQTQQHTANTHNIQNSNQLTKQQQTALT